jgi:hypothetical protein
MTWFYVLLAAWAVFVVAAWAVMTVADAAIDDALGDSPAKNKSGPGIRLEGDGGYWLVRNGGKQK